MTTYTVKPTITVVPTVTVKPSMTVKPSVTVIPGSNIVFSTLVASVSCLQAVQSDLGITLGGTLLASGTTPPAITISGSATTTPALRLEIQTTGARGASTFRYSADGGATWIESGVTTAATYALTGACSGITAAFPVGTYTNDNVYKATVSAWADQTANAKNYSQATAASQPIYTNLLNGVPSLTFDGTNDILTSALTLPAPGTTPTFLWMVFRQITWTNADRIVGCVSSTTQHALLQNSATPQIAMSNSASALNGNTAAAVNSWVRAEAWFNNATSDYLKLGATSVTGSNAGNNASATGKTIGGGNATAFGNIEVMALMYFSGKPTAAELAALSAAVTSKYGATVAV